MPSDYHRGSYRELERCLVEMRDNGARQLWRHATRRYRDAWCAEWKGAAWRHDSRERLWVRAARPPGVAEGPGPPPVRKTIEIDSEDADLLLSLCEPGSTLERPGITEENYRRFVVAQAEAERQRRLEARDRP